MANIKEVADACGVSIATVSNIFNGKGRVSGETRERILRIAKEMNYVPNIMAKNLKQRRSNVIGIITEDLTVFNSVGIVDGIHEFLEENGYTFILGNLRLYKKYNNEFYHNEEYLNQVQEEFHMMKSAQVAGIIYVCAHCREIKFLPEMDQVPVAIAYGFSKNEKVSSIIYDDEQAAYDATNEMICNGHREIGLIMGDKVSMHTSARLKGYQRALYDNGILCNPDYICEGDWSREKGREAADALIKKGVTAIFSMNDDMAAGVYDYAHENNLSIGRDFALVGFDNREICTAFLPALTTMAIPLSEIGRRAAELIVDNLDERESRTGCENYVKCSLIRRDSVNQLL
ncbi:MAG TPA: LacI family transcriptional regulator [Clostridiales bacterium]|nr:LacI family transcriptional regulator [Clostridiales bacterium]